MPHQASRALTRARQGSLAALKREHRYQRIRSETINLVAAAADLAAAAQKLRQGIERATAGSSGREYASLPGYARLVAGLEAGLIQALGNARAEVGRNFGPDLFARFVERVEHLGESTS